MLKIDNQKNKPFLVGISPNERTDSESEHRLHPSPITGYPLAYTYTYTKRYSNDSYQALDSPAVSKVITIFRRELSS